MHIQVDVRATRREYRGRGLNFRPGISGRKRVKALSRFSVKVRTMGTAGSINWVNDSRSRHVRHSEHGLDVARLIRDDYDSGENILAVVTPDKIDAHYIFFNDHTMTCE